MREDHTSMLFVIDRSGSMSPLVDDTIGGFNTVLDDNKQAEGTADVTLCLFDHEFIKSVDHVDIQEVAHLDRGTYVPRGMTALLDAVGMTVSEELAHQASLSDDEKPENTIVTIITDGQENASKEWTYQKVKNLLTTVQEEKQWVVSFLGANIDVAKEAESIGIRQGMTASYMADSIGTTAVYSSVSKMQRMMRGVKKSKMSAEAYRRSVDSIAEESLTDVRDDYAARSGKADAPDGDGIARQGGDPTGKRGGRFDWIPLRKKK